MYTPHVLLAYDEQGDVCATLDFQVVYADDEARTPLGLVDFAAHEAAGGEHTDIWKVGGTMDGKEWTAKGSKVWPEWLGGRAHEFRVELEGPAGGKRIAALVHKSSGHRRERVVLETEIESRIQAKKDEAKGKTPPVEDKAALLAEVMPEPVDLRDLVGGPGRPLDLDADGKTALRVKAEPSKLPLIGIIPEPPKKDAEIAAQLLP